MFWIRNSCQIWCCLRKYLKLTIHEWTSQAEEKNMIAHWRYNIIMLRFWNRLISVLFYIRKMCRCWSKKTNKIKWSVDFSTSLNSCNCNDARFKSQIKLTWSLSILRESWFGCISNYKSYWSDWDIIEWSRLWIRIQNFLIFRFRI